MGIVAAVLALLPQGQTDLRERWVFYLQDLGIRRNVDRLDELMPRAARAGYNGFVLEDPGFCRLPLQGPAYFENLERVRHLAEKHRMKLIPGVFPVGHSQYLLAQDPNLAEGLPVQDARFVVRGGIARLVPDPHLNLGPRWWRDEIVTPDWVVRDPLGRFARISQNVPVRPFRQYHVTAKVRTRGFQGLPRIVVIGRGKMLHYDLPRVQPTQDWTTLHAVFNSLEADEVRMILGCWNGQTGELAWRDPRIEEIGLLNVLRRPGAPLVVRGVDGRVYQEGRDFEKVFDPRLGTAEREGGFEEWHEPPVIRASLSDGTLLCVSYYHALTFPDHGQMMICPSEPKTVELLRDQARRLQEIFRPPAYLMLHDEMRVLNWDESCRARNLTPARIVAENVRTCTRILRELNPEGEIYVWSDMFDPFHNARDGYYLVRGSLAGTWEGLDKDVIIADWYFDRRGESLAWFAGRGHRFLIAGYYDKDPDRGREWLKAARPHPGLVGVMYTTWFDKYEDLETFGRIVQEGGR